METVQDRNVRGPLADALGQLPPGYFALVMGTGIISVGLQEVGQNQLSKLLLILAGVSYVCLWVLFLLRSTLFPASTIANLRDPRMAFAYFTIVAGTDVLAVRLLMADLPGIAIPLVVFAAAIWFIFGYLLPWQVLLTRDGKPILARANGTWFIWAVASQSLAIGVAKVQPYVSPGTRWVGILAVLSWSVGVILYAAMATVVLFRIIHYGITPKEAEPPYWVAMGAMAIAVVAGSAIVDMSPTPMVEASKALIAGTVVVFWCFAAWLIPALIGMGIWRHLLHGVPLRYTPGLWSMVFPLGMFAVASISMGRIDQLPLVEEGGIVFLYISLAVWAVVFLGMVIQISGVLRSALEHRKVAQQNLR